MMTERITPQALPVQEVALPRRWGLRRISSFSLLAVYLTVLIMFVTVGIFAPVLAPYDPNAQELVNRLQPPAWQAGGTWEHPFGTDNLGRDVLSRLIHGTRISLLVVALSVPISMALGTALGLLSGYRRGSVDILLMRAVDLQLALPVILFAILLAAVFGPGLRNVLIIIVAWRWAAYARVVRGAVLSLRERDFVTASRVLGAGDVWVMGRHLLPNLVNTVMVIATLDVAVVILIEASLSFLGVGVSLSTPSWGLMVSEGRNFITIAWWLVTIPGLAILLISLVGNLLGDWLRDALDPRLRNVR